MSRNRIVPKDFVAKLKRGIKGYSKLSAKHRVCLAYYILNSGTWWSQHKNPEWDDYMTIHYRELEKKFGRGGFAVINGELNIFEVTPNWNAKKKQTRGYRLREDVQEIKTKYLSPRKRNTTEFNGLDGRAIRSVPQSVAAKDAAGRTSVWNKARPPKIVPIDVELLTNLWHDMEKRVKGKTDLYVQGDAEDYRYKADSLGLLLRMANTDIAGRGYLMQRYEESNSGRLYATGINLQNTPRAIRKAALNGLYEYDMENCHYTLFCQLAARNSYEAKSITHYLENKVEVREQLSRELGLEIDQVKTCLLSILYGARVNTWYKNAIPREIGQEKAGLLYNHPLFKGIHKDIKEGRLEILDRWPINNRGFLKNDLGKPISSLESRAQILAHLLQGIEAKALRTVVQDIPDNVLVLMHDGFVTRKRINKKDMAQKISEATGFKLELSGGEKIALPADLNS